MPQKPPLRNRKKRSRNPLRSDPTRTAGLRRKFLGELRRRFAKVRAEVLRVIRDQDSLGLLPSPLNPFNFNRLTANESWRMLHDPEKVKAFEAWLRQLLRSEVIGLTEDQLWKKYVEEGLKKGAGRAFDDTRRPQRLKAELEGKPPEYYQGTRDEFLQSAFNQPVAVEKVKLLVGRTFGNLRDVTFSMANRMTQVLADGLVQGQSPHDIARALDEALGIGRRRAERIAQHEIAIAHSEGQLLALDGLGVEEVGVAVEWTTSGLGTTAKGNPSPCPICKPLEGMVLKLSEAKGMLPRHVG